MKIEASTHVELLCKHFIKKTCRLSYKRQKKEKKMLLKQFVLEGVEEGFVLSQQNRKPKVKMNLLRSMESSQQEKTEDGDVHQCFLTILLSDFGSNIFYKFLTFLCL